MSLADLDRLEMARPESLADACALVAERVLADESTVWLAGGTDWLVELKQAPPSTRSAGLPLVADIGQLAELRGIDWDGRVVRIGAANTFAEIGADPVVCERLPLVARMTHDIGGPTIQARGTLGGNLATASPAADGVAALAALDAVIVVQSVRGPRRIPLSELQSGYKQSSRKADEIIVAVEIEAPPQGAHWVWRKVGARRAQAISKVALAAWAEVGPRRVIRFGAAAASVAPVTALMEHTRSLVTNAALGSIEARVADEAVNADIEPIDDLRSTKQYRAHCLRALVRGFLGEIGALV